MECKIINCADSYGFGSVIVAELQDIKTMKRECYLPEDY